MAKTRLSSPRARLFVALDLPAPVRERLAAWRDEAIAGRDDLRPVAVESLHVTLVFLGYHAEKEVPEIGPLVQDAAAGCAPVPLRMAEARSVPPRRPRLFALGLEDDDAAARELQQALSDALEAARLYKPEKRPFWPHVTLARVKAKRRAEPLEAATPPIEPFEASEVTLYRSILRPQGALYEPIDTVRLV